MNFTRYIYPLTLRDKISYRLRSFYRHSKNLGVPLHFGNNVKLDLLKNDFGHMQIMLTGFYELQLSRRIKKLAKKGGILFDVGANYGYYSTIWGSLKPNNKVFAFEASPLNVEPLKNNIRKNNLENQVKLISTAMGKEEGKLKFSLGSSSNQSGWGGLTINESENDVEVDVNTIDNFASANGIDHIDVLKIDTEGADTWVLYGARKLLEAKKIKHVFFEVNLPRMDMLNISPDEAPNFLREMGYRIKSISKWDRYAFPK